MNQLLKEYYETDVASERHRAALSSISTSLNAIRSLVSSVMACWNPIVINPEEKSSHLHVSPDNRFLLDLVHRFHESYVQLSGWIDQQMESLNATVDVDSSQSPRPLPHVPSSHPVSLGHDLLNDFQSRVLPIFESLQSQGQTTLIDPLVLKHALREQAIEVASNKSSASSTSNQAPSSIEPQSALTLEDRALLAKLWSHVDMMNDSTSCEPPKPPFFHNFGNAPSTNQTISHQKPVNSDFPTYLNMLADIIRPKTDSKESPAVVLGIQSGCSSFRSIDQSDSQSTHSSSASGPHAIVDLSRFVHSPSADSRFSTVDGNHASFCRSRSVPQMSSDTARDKPTCSSDNKSSAYLSNSSWDHDIPLLNSPLDDNRMQEAVAAAMMQQQVLETQPDYSDLFNPLCSANASSCNQCLANHQTNARNPDNTLPRCHSEFKTNTEADWEMIEVDGKKYRKHFERRVVIQRHRTKQFLIAPTLADGSGPDLSRAISTEPSERSSSALLSDSDSEPVVDSVSDQDEHETDSRQPTASPPKPLFQLRKKMINKNRPLTNYMFRFGMSLYNECDLEDAGNHPTNEKLPPALKFFRSKWLKSEDGPTSLNRSKTIAYVQQSALSTPTGETIKQSTCVEHTCAVQRLDELQPSDAIREDPPTPFTEPLDDEELESDVSSIDLTEESRPFSSSVTALTGEILSTPLQDQTSSTVPTVTRAPSTKSRVAAEKCDEILTLPNADHLIVFSDSPSEYHILAGCVDALIVHLTRNKCDHPRHPNFVRSFLVTYRVFLSSESFIDRLITRYNFFHQQSSSADSQLHSEICSGTLDVLLTLISYLSCDFSPCMRLLVAFQKTIDPADQAKFTQAIATGTKQHLKRQFHDMLNLQHSAPFVGSLNLSSESSGDSSTTRVHTSSTTEDLRFGPFKRNLFNSIKPKHSFAAPFSSNRVSPEASLSSISLLNRLSEPPPTLAHGLTVCSFSSRDIAEQLTYLEAKKFDQIRLTELLNIKCLERGEAPSVSACAAHFSTVSNWVLYQILKANAQERDKVAFKFICVMSKLRRLKNYSGFLALLCSFLLAPESLFSTKIRSKLKQLKRFMQPPAFTLYRKELNSADPPFIPYLGLMMQNLVMLAQGNPLFSPTIPEQMIHAYRKEYGPVVNVWRCQKHFAIIAPFYQLYNLAGVTTLYSIKPNPRVLQFLNDFQDALPEADLRDLANNVRHA